MAITIRLTMTAKQEKNVVVPPTFARITRFACCALLVSSMSAQAADRIEVTAETTPVKDGDEILLVVSQGQQFDVLRIQEEWFLVQVPDSERVGWVYRPHVREMDPLEKSDPASAESSSTPTSSNPRLRESAELTIRVEAMIEDGRHAAALPFAERALSIRRELLGKIDVETNRSLHYVALLQSLLGQYDEARAHYQEALEVALEVHGGPNFETASLEFELGNVLRSMSEYKLAKVHLENAAAVQGNVVGRDATATLYSVFRLAQVLHRLGELDSASRSYGQALNTARTVLGNEDAVTLRIVMELGRLRRQMNDIDAARRLLAEALKTRQKLHGWNDAEVLKLLTELGTIFESQGNHSKARKYYSKALSIFDKMEPLDPESIASVSFRLAMVLTAVGENQSAEQQLERTLALQLEVFGENRLEPAVSYFHLGRVQQQQGHFKAAKTNYQQAVEVWRRVGGQAQSAEFAAMLLGLSSVHASLGEHESTLATLAEALGIYETLLGENHPDLVALLRSLGNVHARLKNLEQSQIHLNRAVEIAQANEGSGESLAKWVLMDAGNTSAELGAFEDARRYYSDVLSIRESEGTVNTAEGVALLTKFGNVLVHMDRFSKARKILERAASIETEMLNEEYDPQLSESLLTLARVCIADGDSKAATVYIDKVRRSVCHHQTNSLAGRSPREQANRLGSAGLLSWAFALSFGYEHRHDRDVVAHSAEWLLNGKGRSAETHAGIDADSGPIWRTVADVRATIPTDSVLVNIARFRLEKFPTAATAIQESPWHYVAWIIPSADGPPIDVVDLGPAEPIDEAVAAARREIGNVPISSDDGDEDTSASVRGSLESLSRLIWNPLAQHITGVQEILLSPDGSLWHVPWAALPWGQWDYLVEVYRFRYLISGRELVSPPHQTENRNSVIFADPDYDIEVPSAQSSGRVQSAEQSGAPASSFLRQIQRLSDTARVAKRLRTTLATYGTDESELLLASDATESRFSQLARPRFLMLGTHNFFPVHELSEENKIGKEVEYSLPHCGFLLAGSRAKYGKNVSVQEDGLLTGLEIVASDLKGTELVVLSDCNTDPVDAQNGDGVVLLRQAFQLAGANSVIATLWRLDNSETPTLLNAFFRHLAVSQSKSKALRNAQLAIIEARRQVVGSAHPYYWAAFTVTGHD